MIRTYLESGLSSRETDAGQVLGWVNGGISKAREIAYVAIFGKVIPRMGCISWMVRHADSGSPSGFCVPKKITSSYPGITEKHNGTFRDGLNCF